MFVAYRPWYFKLCRGGPVKIKPCICNCIFIVFVFVLLLVLNWQRLKYYITLYAQGQLAAGSGTRLPLIFWQLPERQILAKLRIMTCIYLESHHRMGEKKYIFWHCDYVFQKYIDALSFTLLYRPIQSLNEPVFNQIGPFSNELWIAIILKCITFSIFVYVVEWFHNYNLVGFDVMYLVI